MSTSRVRKPTSKAQAFRETSIFDDGYVKEYEVHRESSVGGSKIAPKLEKCENKMVQAMKAAAIEAVASGNFTGDLVMSAKNDSGYEGVDFHQGKWRARIRTNPNPNPNPNWR